MTDEIDAETLAIMKRYCGGDPREPRHVEVDALCVYASERWTIAEFQTLIANAVATIPAESLADARIELQGDYEGCGSLRISYERLETEAEVADHVARAFAYARNEQISERHTYEQLKRKFG